MTGQSVALEPEKHLAQESDITCHCVLPEQQLGVEVKLDKIVPDLMVGHFQKSLMGN